MPHLKIDFSKIKEELEEDPLPKEKKTYQVKRSNSRGKRLITYLVVFLIILVVISGIKSIFGETENNQGINFWTQFKHLVTSRDKTLKGEENGRINLLLLGMGGVGHDGPYLTDTIILVSLKPTEKKVALLSIPRDLVMPIPGYGWRKINNANAYGEVANPGYGANLTVKTISNVFQIPIHYYLRIDFAGFTDFIDELGNIKVCVEKSFIDGQYPTKDYKIQTISFTAGCQMMDGETALKFVRSRHGNNGEGSDYARSKRQQKIILATKDKLLSFSTLTNPLTIKKLYNQYFDHIATNIEIWEMIRLAQLGKGIGKDDIITQSLDEGRDEELEIVIGENGAFLLQPPGGNYDKIRKLVADIFGQESLIEAEKKLAQQAEAAEEEIRRKKKDAKKAAKENAKIEIRNGTFIVGLAGDVQAHLQSLGYNVPEIGNAPFRDYEKNVIYDLSEGNFLQTIEFLTQEFKANVSTTVPGWIKNISASDLVIILGQEAGELEILN